MQEKKVTVNDMKELVINKFILFGPIKCWDLHKQMREILSMNLIFMLVLIVLRLRSELY
jgi:hypothetical protein